MKRIPWVSTGVLGFVLISAAACKDGNSETRSEVPPQRTTTLVADSKDEGGGSLARGPTLEEIDRVTTEGTSLESVHDVLGAPDRVDPESDGLQLLRYEFDSLIVEDDANATFYLTGLLVIAREGRVVNALRSYTSFGKGPSDREVVVTNVNVSIRFVALGTDREHHELASGKLNGKEIDQLSAPLGQVEFDGLKKLSFDPPPPARADGERPPMGSLRLELFERDHDGMARFTGEHVDHYVVMAIDSKIIGGGVVRGAIENGILELPVPNSPALFEIMAALQTR